MSALNSVITAFCAAGICFGAIFIISPSGKTEKSVKYVLSLCFLLIIISVTGIKVNFEELQTHFTASEVNAEALNTAAAEYTIGVALQKAGIDFKEILVSMDNSDNSGIGFTKVKIYTECTKERIIEALGQDSENLEVEVINE